MTESAQAAATQHRNSEQLDGEQLDNEQLDGEQSDGEPTDGVQADNAHTDDEPTDQPREQRPDQPADTGVGLTGDSARPAATERLEREGEIAADYLETLLDVADLDGDLDVDIDGDRAAVSIVDSDEGQVPRRLVGRDGEVLEALQELARLAVLARTGERSRLMLDVAGHRSARREALVARAGEAVTQVRQSGERLELEAMTPFERKVVHDAVAEQGLTTESEGVEPHRHVVVLPV